MDRRSWTPGMCLLRADNLSAVLKAETETCMRLLGAQSINDLGIQYVSIVRRFLVFEVNEGAT